MDLLVCFWLEVDNGLKIKHLKSIMFGHAKVKDVVTRDTQGISHSSQNNIYIWTKCEQVYTEEIKPDKKEKVYQQLLKCLSRCLLHVCHNSFKNGNVKYGYNIEEFCISLYYFFKRSSYQWQRPVWNRRVSWTWIYFTASCSKLLAFSSISLEWLVKIKEAVNKILLMELPKNDSNTRKNDKYLYMKKVLVVYFMYNFTLLWFCNITPELLYVF